MNENIVLTKKEMRALKKYYRSPNHAIDGYDSLLELSLIKRDLQFSTFPQNDKRIIYHITPAGKQCYLKNRKNNFRYFLTTFIAVIALIKSFFPELVSLWKLLMQ
jgi:hypothetical protein